MARIMVVDDSKIMRRTLRHHLENAGHTVIAEAENGMYAYVEYDRLKPDIVTMDFDMPVMNGLDAAQKILNFDPEARIIMISGQHKQEHVVECIRAGVKNYILKPITLEKLIAAISRVME